MKLNIACPSTGAQKWVEVDDEKKLRALYDNRIGAEVEGEALGEEFNGYVFRISGGNDKQGFPMKQGVLCNHRVKLLLRAGASCYRQRRSGERKRKSVRGCVVGPDLAVLDEAVRVERRGLKVRHGREHAADAWQRRRGRRGRAVEAREWLILHTPALQYADVRTIFISQHVNDAVCAGAAADSSRAGLRAYSTWIASSGAGATSMSPGLGPPVCCQQLPAALSGVGAPGDATPSAA